MAISHVRDHPTGTSAAASASIATTLSAAVPAINTLVAVDLSESSYAVTGLTKPANETATWQRVVAGTGGLSGGGGAEAWAIQTTVEWPSGTTVTSTRNASSANRALLISEFAGGLVARPRATAVTSSQDFGAPATALPVNSSVPGDLVLGLGVWSSAGTVTPDTDTLNGSWATGSGVNVGSGGTGLSALLQWKIPTASGQQTYNPTGPGGTSSSTVVALVASAEYVRTRGTGTATTSGSTFTVMSGVAVEVDRTLVMAVAFNNLTTTTPDVTSITKPAAETNNWERVGQVGPSVATAAEGVRTEFWAIKTSVAWAASQSLTVTLSESVTAKAAVISEFAQVLLPAAEVVTGYSTSRTPTATTSVALVPGDIVIGAWGAESWQSSADDTDTTAGDWGSAHGTAASLSGEATSISVAIQAKVVLAAGNQTYNPTTAGGSDAGVVLAVLRQNVIAAPVSSYSIALDPSTASTAQALEPTLSLSTGVTPPVASATSSAPAPTVTARRNISIAVPIASPATASARNPSSIIAIIRVDASITPPVATVAANAGDPSGIFGTGVSNTVFAASGSGQAFVPTIAAPNRIATDFSTATTGSDLPTGWTAFSGAYAIQDNAGADGGKELYLSNDPHVGATWDLLSGLKGNYLLRMRNVDSQASAGLLIGALNSFKYTRVAVQGVLGGRLAVQRRISSGSTTSTLATAPATNLGSDLDDGTYIWLRVSLGEAGLVRAKAWRQGQVEPAWQLEYTPPTLDTGTKIGPFADGGAAGTSVWIDSLEWLPGTTGVDTSTALRWQTLPLVTKNLSARWAARQAVDKTRSLLWAIAAPPVSVQTSVDLRWTGVQTVQTSTALRWDSFQAVVVSRALRWVSTEPVDQVSRSLRWNIREVVETRTVGLRWGAVERVAEPTTVRIEWANQVPIEKRLVVRWVTQSEGRVTTSLRSRWDTLVTATKTLRTRWSSNLDALGVLVEDFDDDPLGTLRPAAESRWQPFNDQSQFSQELHSDPSPGYGKAPSTVGITVLEDIGALGRRFLRKTNSSASPIYYLDEPDPWEHDVVVRVRAQAGEPIVIDVSPPNTRRFGYSTHRLVGDFTSGGRWQFGYWYAPQNEFNRFTQSSTVLMPWSAGEWMWARIQLRHDKINRLTQGKAKVWRDGTPEPKNWTLDYTLAGVSGPAQLPPGSRQLGTSNEYVIYPAPLDLDRVSWTTPHTRAVLAGPATARMAALEASVSLRQTILAPTGGANIGLPEPSVEIGDQVLVSWFALEIPAAVSIVEAVTVENLGSAGAMALAPTVTAQASRSVAVPIVDLASIRMPTPIVMGHAGVGVGLDAGTPALFTALAPIVRVVARATVFVSTATALGEALPATLITQLNARVDAPTSSATVRSPKPDSINGSREVDVEVRSNAGFSMIPVQSIIATLSIDVENATLMQAQMLPADPRTGLSVPAGTTATASASFLAPTVQTGIRISVPALAATFRARDTVLTRTTTRFSVGVTALAAIEGYDPIIQVFFRRDDVSVTVTNRATATMAALVATYAYSPAALDDTKAIYLGSRATELVLSNRSTDIYLGAQKVDLQLSKVRNEVRV